MRCQQGCWHVQAAVYGFCRTSKARLRHVVRRNHTGIELESQWHVGKVHLPGHFEMSASHHLLLHLALVQQRVLVEMAWTSCVLTTAPAAFSAEKAAVCYPSFSAGCFPRNRTAWHEEQRPVITPVGLPVPVWFGCRALLLPVREKAGPEKSLVSRSRTVPAATALRRLGNISQSVMLHLCLSGPRCYLETAPRPRAFYCL